MITKMFSATLRGIDAVEVEVEVNARGILHGPLLVKNLTSETSLALGRGVARKIQVEISTDEL